MIDSLLIPYLFSDFLSSYWGKNFLLINGDTGKFDSIITVDRIEDFITQNEDLFYYPRVTMYQDGNIIPEVRFTKSSRMRISGALGYKSENVIDVKKITRLFDKGATFKISQLEQIFPAMKQICNSFSDSIKLVEEIHLNLYYSPPASRAFKSHFDKHDVFILQISGSKTWEIFNHLEDNPLPEYKIPRTDNYLATEKHIINLNKGDLLYIPRGMWHNVYSKDSSSLHLTVGIRPKTVIDLFYYMENEMLNDRYFRSNIKTEDFQSIFFKQQFIDKISEFLDNKEILEKFSTYSKSHTDKIKFS